MKVALVHSYYSGDAPSGENIVVEAQYRALLDRGVDARIIGVRTDDLSKMYGYKIRTAAKVATGLGLSPLREIEGFDPDIVHVHNLFPNWSTSWLDAWHGKIVATVHNYRSVCASGTLFREGKFCDACFQKGSFSAVIHGCYRGSSLGSLPLAIQNRRGVAGNPLLRRADRVISLSHRANHLLQTFGLEKSKLSLVPNFVEDEGFAPTATPGQHWAYIGRLSEEKGILELLQNWPANEQLRIFGDGALRSKVSEMCDRNIRLEGPIDRSEVPMVLSQARGLVFPSLTPEGAVPLTYVEALAAGRPTVSRAGNGAADDIDASGTGKVFSDWSQLGECIKEVSADLSPMTVRARRHYETQFTKSIWTDLITQLYTDVLRRTPTNP
jgi:glycosyltransferase involved in cell wall biosynthesis